LRSALGEPPGSPRPLPPVRFADERFALDLRGLSWRSYAPFRPQVYVEGMAAAGERRVRLGSKAIGLAAVVAALLALLAARSDAAGPSALPQAAPSPGLDGQRVGVVVRERLRESARAERLVRRLGGRVTRALPIVGGFAADVPARALVELRRSPAVASVWRDARVEMAEVDDDAGQSDDDLVDLTQYDGLSPNTAWRRAVGVSAVERAYDGDDVAVAVIDTGVSSVADLSDTVEARVEFTPGHDGIDRFGHGTHMAGIIAGDGSSSGGRWRGVAPDAELISIKTAGPDGATDVSAVLAALQWVVVNKRRHDIRVLNLSFGTDAARSYLTDPLNYAVERVWRAGILVVVAAGNRGPHPGSIAKPGDDPFVLTVGAADLRDTVGRSDDEVAPFSSRGPTADGVAKPDLVAPGVSIVSSRAPGSWADLSRPEARVGTEYFKGTGTSQAAAIVCGIAALLFEADPWLTPTEAKAALVGTSHGLSGQPGAGSGLVDAARAIDAVRSGTYAAAAGNAPYPPATGTGELELSRGSSHVYSDLDRDGVPELVTGELDVLGNRWDSATWSSTPWSAWGWRASPWGPLAGEFEEWELLPWTGPTWSGMVWDAEAWSARQWSESGWVARQWSARQWSARQWSASVWN
jgi:serine protease AprX